MDADAVVVGAGAAGLNAARLLAERGLHVVLVEARDRIGGRILPHALTPAATADLGAEFIHGSAIETLALLESAGLQAVSTGDESWYRDESGGMVRDDDDFRSGVSVFEAARALREDQSVDEFLNRLDASQRDMALAARAFVEGFDAADPAIASAKAIAEEWHSGVDLSSARPVGGYGPLLHYLRDRCVEAGVEVRLSTVVRSIAWERGRVTVECRNSEAPSSEAQGRVAILTLPAAVLRYGEEDGAVRLEPDLPLEKRNALAAIETGDVVKVALAFRSRFWERMANGAYRDAAFFSGDGHFGVFWTQMPLRSDALIAWCGGPKATALVSHSEEELVDIALGELGKLFGDAAMVRDEFQRGTVHDWCHDPYARGAYSYLRVGAGSARSLLAEPAERTLFFAGEATSANGQAGTVNGALETGERAAAQVVAALRAEVA